MPLMPSDVSQGNASFLSMTNVVKHQSETGYHVGFWAFFQDSFQNQCQCRTCLGPVFEEICRPDGYHIGVHYSFWFVVAAGASPHALDEGSAHNLACHNAGNCKLARSVTPKMRSA